MSGTLATNPVTHLRAVLLPLLEAWAHELRAEHPDAKINVYATEIGTSTDFQGYVVGIDCLIANVPLDRSDNVALQVGLKHLNRTALIDCAGVVWGHPSGQIEAELLPAPTGFSPENLAAIVQRLPELFVALQQALQRGPPPAR